MTTKATGKFVWNEYVTTDIAKAQGFFGELFNWSVKNVPMGASTYAMIESGGTTIGGYQPTPAGAPTHAHWLSHLGVADTRETAAKVTANGGKVLAAPFPVGDVGTMAVVADPHGGTFALWQPAKSTDQPAPQGVGTFTWYELASADPAASVAFYTAISGLTDKPMEMPGTGTYHVLEADGEMRAGIMKQMMPGQPHAWLPYVQVASADATAEKAKRLGATLFVGPTDIPNVGRFAIFADPQGAALGVLQPIER